MDNNLKQSVKSFSTMEGVLLMIGLVLVSVIFAAFVWMVSGYPDRIALPTLSIAGIVLLLICLTGVSYVFARAGLQNNNEALGLPAGSIQSVIALSLIVLFAILSVFLFSAIGASPLRELKNLNAADRNDQISKLGSSFAGWEPQTDPEKFTIFVRDPGIDARNDVGKQLIVLIGTLMTSAVSFYFGSRATASGVAAVTGGTGRTPPVIVDPDPDPDPDPDSAAITGAVISKIEPTTALLRGQDTTVTVTGTGLATATTVAVRQGSTELSVSGVISSDTQISFSVSPAADAAAGAYDLVVLANATALAIRQNALTIASP